MTAIAQAIIIRTNIHDNTQLTADTAGPLVDRYEDRLAAGVPHRPAALLDDLPPCGRDAWGDDWDNQDPVKYDTNRDRLPRRGCSWTPRHGRHVGAKKHRSVTGKYVKSANTALLDLPGPELVHHGLLVFATVVPGELEDGDVLPAHLEHAVPYPGGCTTGQSKLLPLTSHVRELDRPAEHLHILPGRRDGDEEAKLAVLNPEKQ